MKFRAVILIVLSSLETLPLVSLSAINKESEFYFEPSNFPVTLLTNTNYYDVIRDEQKAKILLFYSSLSNNCRQLVPVYKKFAKDVFTWSNIIEFMAMNCTDEVNNNVCQRQSVLEYPTLKFFPPNSDPFGGQVIHLSEYTTDELMKLTIATLMDHSRENNVPASWPHFQELEADSKASLLQQLDLFINLPLLLLVENPSSTLGVKIMLDISLYKHEVRVFRISTKKAVIQQLLPDTSIVPVLLQIKSSGEEDVIERSHPNENEEETRRRFVRRIKEDFIQTTPLIYDIEAQEGRNTSQEVVELETVKVHYADLYNALRQTLYIDVPAKNTLNEDQIQTMQIFFEVLMNFFPTTNENYKRLIQRMEEWFDLRSQKSVSTENYMAILRAGGEGFLPPLQPYKKCENGNETNPTKGYPCSLWLLFHVLTVAEYNQKGRALMRRNCHTVLYAMRDYVEYFYADNYAADLFMNASNNLQAELRHPNSSVLWLWEKHNDLNAILGNTTKEENPKRPKTEFPPPEMCPDCKGSDGQWNKTAVLEFLVKHYDKPNFIRDGQCSLCLNYYCTLLIMLIVLFPKYF